MTVSGCKGIQNHKVGDDYLAYSPLTGETVVLSSLADFVLNKVASQAFNYQELLKQVEQKFFDTNDISSILQRTLKELSKKGFVYY